MVEKVGARVGRAQRQQADLVRDVVRLVLEAGSRVGVYRSIEHDAERHTEEHENRDDDRQRRCKQQPSHVIRSRSGIRRRARW